MSRKFSKRKSNKARQSGGAEGNRTPDLLIANEALSQLSYNPNLFAKTGSYNQTYLFVKI